MSAFRLRDFGRVRVSLTKVNYRSTDDDSGGSDGSGLWCVCSHSRTSFIILGARGMDAQMRKVKRAQNLFPLCTLQRAIFPWPYGRADYYYSGNHRQLRHEMRLYLIKS